MYKPNMSFSEPILLEDYIMVTILPDWHEFVERIHLAEKYFEENGLTTADSRTNVMSKYHTPYRSQIHVDHFDHLLARILHEIHYAQENFRGIKRTSLWDHLKVGECWIAKYEEGDTTQQHVHYPYHLVSTFYYDVEKSTPFVLQYYDDTGIQLKEIEVSNGMLIVTPGALKHSVPPCKGRRSVFATNWFYDISKFIEESA